MPPYQEEISAVAITATKTLSGTRCVNSWWRRTVKTAAAIDQRSICTRIDRASGKPKASAAA